MVVRLVAVLQLLLCCVLCGAGTISPSVKCLFDPETRIFQVHIPGDAPDAPGLGILDLQQSNKKESSLTSESSVPKTVKGFTLIDTATDYSFKLFDRSNKLLKQERNRDKLKKSWKYLESIEGWIGKKGEYFMRASKGTHYVEWIEYHDKEEFARFEEVYISLSHHVVILFDKGREIWLQIVSSHPNIRYTKMQSARGFEGVILWARKPLVDGKVSISPEEWALLEHGHWIVK